MRLIAKRSTVTPHRPLPPLPHYSTPALNRGQFFVGICWAQYKILNYQLLRRRFSRVDQGIYLEILLR